MKFFVLFVSFIFSLNLCFASSIGTYSYKTMPIRTYRTNYTRQTDYRVVPYWQAQSNFSTRNRTYQNYANYSRYMNNARYNNTYRSYR